MGIKNGSRKKGDWSAVEVQRLIAKRFHFEPSLEDCVKAMKGVGCTNHTRIPSRFSNWEERLSPIYTNWIASPAAVELKAKERAFRARRKRKKSPIRRGPFPHNERDWRTRLRAYQIEASEMPGKMDMEAIAEWLGEKEEFSS